MADFFQINVRLLEQKSPGLARMVTACRPDGKYTVCPAKNGSLTIQCHHASGKTYHYHSLYNPEREAVRLVDSYYYTHREEVDEGVFALIFGCGFGYQIQAFLHKVTWLKQLIIFEPDIQLLALVLRHRDFTWLLGQKNIHLLCGEITKEDLVAIHRSYVFTMSRWAVLEIPPVSQLFSGYVQRCTETFSRYLNACDAFAMTYMRNGARMLESRYRNLVHMLQGHMVNDLFDAFRGRAFICVASGPSLNEQLDNLRRAQKNAVIIAADSAVPVLIEHGITPHVVTAFDPIYRKFQYFVDNPHVTRDMVLICPLEVYHGLLDVWQGPKLFCSVESMNQSCYENYESIVFPHAKTVFASPTVALASLVFAHQLGASRIVLAGQDLRLYETTHAEGVTLKKRMTFNEDFTCALIHKADGRVKEIAITTSEDYDGNIVPTEKAYAFYLSRFGEFIISNDVQVFNVTRTGARIPGAPRVDFAEVEHFFTVPVDFRSIFDTVQFVEPGSPDKLVANLTTLMADAECIGDRFAQAWEQSASAGGQKERYYYLESVIDKISRQYLQCFQLLSSHVSTDVIAYGKARFVNLSRMTDPEKYVYLLENTEKYFQALMKGAELFRENLNIALERIAGAFPGSSTQKQDS